MFIPWGLHLDFAPDISNGAVFLFLESILNQRNGMVISIGGIQVMIDSIVKMIEARGVILFVSCMHCIHVFSYKIEF